MEDTEGKYLKERLFNIKKNGWLKTNEEDVTAINKYADEYMYFLNKCKTEKEAVEVSKDILIKNGFVDIAEKDELNPGDKIFFVNRERSIYAAVIGEEPLEEGLRILAGHIDSRRIDL